MYLGTFQWFLADYSDTFYITYTFSYTLVLQLLKYIWGVYNMQNMTVWFEKHKY